MNKLAGEFSSAKKKAELANECHNLNIKYKALHGTPDGRFIQHCLQTWDATTQDYKGIVKILWETQNEYLILLNRDT